MTDAKSTLSKVMEVLGIATPNEVETPVALAEPVAPEVPEEVTVEETPAVEEEMAIEDVVAALESRLKALEDHIAALVAEEVADEAPALPVEVPVEEAPMMKKKSMMSEVKPFNGAPVEEKSEAIVKMKAAGTLGTVLARLYN